ncbi:MAG: pyridoxal-phosphate dependent enzyme [Candidatus Margulisbacteria bacterium]|nr:pyridoxal-phosphate dependent enzyme [Candidatus Margulisiibacteriota bacterium]
MQSTYPSLKKVIALDIRIVCSAFKSLKAEKGPLIQTTLEQLKVQDLTREEIQKAHQTLADIGISPVVVREINLRHIEEYAAAFPEDFSRDGVAHLRKLLEQFRVVILDATQRITGSYKECGAAYAIDSLSFEEKALGVVTASAGNHGLGVALAAVNQQVLATIVVPKSAPDIKKKNIAALLENALKGSRFIEYGDTFDEAAAYARTLAGTYVSPYNHPNVWLGQAYNFTSAIKELSKMGIDVKDISKIICPVGGGGFVSGVAQAAHHSKREIEIIAVEPQTHAKFSSNPPPESFDQLISVPAGTVALADGTATKQYGNLTYWTLLKLVSDFHQVTNQEIKSSIRFLFQAMAITSEGAGALPLAFLLKPIEEDTHMPPVTDGAKKPVILAYVSGRNIDPDALTKILKENKMNRGQSLF